MGRFPDNERYAAYSSRALAKRDQYLPPEQIRQRHPSVPEKVILYARQIRKIPEGERRFQANIIARPTGADQQAQETAHWMQRVSAMRNGQLKRFIAAYEDVYPIQNKGKEKSRKKFGEVVNVADLEAKQHGGKKHKHKKHGKHH